jgi:hypothetical protein
MKKVIVRIFIILFAASLIGASWYAYDMTSSDQSTLQDGRGEFAPDGERSEDGDLERRPREGVEGEGESNSVSQLLSGTAVIVAQTALVVAAVTLLRMLINKVEPIVSKKKIASSTS